MPLAVTPAGSDYAGGVFLVCTSTTNRDHISTEFVALLSACPSCSEFP